MYRKSPAKTQLNRSRRDAFMAQSGLCFWCGVPMYRARDPGYRQAPHRLSTAEHLTPKSEGGGNGAACLRCNTARKNHPLAIWLERVKQRLELSDRPHWFDVILSNLENRGIRIPSANSSPGPRQSQTADCPAPPGTPGPA